MSLENVILVKTAFVLGETKAREHIYRKIKNRKRIKK